MPRRPRSRGRTGLYVRWSWRDLRARWLQVAAIALIVGLGSGVFTGLGSSSSWRRQAYDASYAAANTHDLLVTLASGTTVGRADLESALQQVRHPDWFTGDTVRLTARSQLEIRRPGDDLLVPGLLVGVDLRDGGPAIDRLSTAAGRGLREGDIDRDVVTLDRHFAKLNDVAPSGTLITSGGTTMQWVGQQLSPQYFLVANEQSALLGARGYAVMYSSLETVQRLTDQPGQVSEAGVTLADGVDVAAARADLEQALRTALPDAAATVTPLADERAYSIIYNDIEGDQKLFNIFAFLILAGAAFAAFNLTSRIVESQRREIGIGMALGEPPPEIAIRPLLVGAQIALLGVVLGVLVGIPLGNLMGDLNQSLFEMPVWATPFQWGVFLRGAWLGFVLTFVATALPVLRAVRVRPVDAIQTRPRVGKRPRGGRLHLPGRSLAQLPLRNITRAPRRAALTVLGIAAVIATLIGVIGMLDSIVRTVDLGEQELTHDSPHRMEVSLVTFTTPDDPELTALADLPGVAHVEPELQVPGKLGRGSAGFDVLVNLLDYHNPIWVPSLTSGRLQRAQPAVLISKKAASDLGVGVGDRVPLRHPYRVGTGYRWETTDVLVGGIHPNPYRFLVFMDIRDASLMNLAGIVNSAQLQPAAGANVEQVRRTVFYADGVASVQPISAYVATIRTALDAIKGPFTVVEAVVLLLAVLIAFNSTSISSDERVREHATMFAFGVPPRTVLATLVAESAIVGLVATILGCVVGVGLLGWIIRVLIPDTLPDLLITPWVSAGTFVTAGVLGVLAVALSPVLTARRLSRLDVPAKLRVVE